MRKSMPPAFRCFLRHGSRSLSRRPLQRSALRTSHRQILTLVTRIQSRPRTSAPTIIIAVTVEAPTQLPHTTHLISIFLQRPRPRWKGNQIILTCTIFQAYPVTSNHILNTTTHSFPLAFHRSPPTPSPTPHQLLPTCPAPILMKHMQKIH
jgi:hypothetical protein